MFSRKMNRLAPKADNISIYADRVGDGQAPADICSMAPFNRLADPTEIPASLAALLRPVPLANNSLAFSALASEMGGRPNFTFKFLAAAWPRRIRSRRP